MVSMASEKHNRRRNKSPPASHPVWVLSQQLRWSGLRPFLGDLLAARQPGSSPNSWDGLVSDLSLESSLLLPNLLFFPKGRCEELVPKPSLGG